MNILKEISALIIWNTNKTSLFTLKTFTDFATFPKLYPDVYLTLKCKSANFIGFSKGNILRTLLVTDSRVQIFDTYSNQQNTYMRKVFSGDISRPKTALTSTFLAYTAAAVNEKHGVVLLPRTLR
eukprot:TRINITY_DN20154_c0_g1_i1.p1 TRINITY_DN20154_c0_g1~~TRINITY_DN20154_c0_g1_i1.p1  ORF type:complete len:125 (-),score=7.07 TRINITY_DN20154_c0_g1_i1:4-378(-)